MIQATAPSAFTTIAAANPVPISSGFADTPVGMRSSSRLVRRFSTSTIHSARPPSTMWEYSSASIIPASASRPVPEQPPGPKHSCVPPTSYDRVEP